MNRQNRGSAIVLAIVVIALVILVAFLVYARVGQKSRGPTNTDQTTQKAASPTGLRGFNFLPKNFSSSGFSDFFSKLPKSRAAVTWAGDWQEIERSSGAPQTVANLAKKYNYEPIFLVSTYKDAGSFGNVVPIRPIESNGQAYIDGAVAFCKKYSPAYFGIGIETNRIYASSVAEFEKFVNLFDQTADAMHAACSSTKIFTAFNLEHLRGLRGGLFGGVNNENKNDWQLLDRFGKADFLAFTTYPGIVYKDPSEMSANYYSAIIAHTNKSVAFSEAGWPSKISAAGWASSEDEQTRFIETFISQTKNLKPLFSIWSFLYDQNLPDPFQDIGLINSEGTPRSGYQLWINQ